MVYSCSTSYLGPQIQALHYPQAWTSHLATLVNAMLLSLESSFGRTLSKREQQDVQNAFYLLDKKTSGKKHPREFQMMAALEILNGKNIVVRAGTGAGKTIAMGLPMLLRPDWTFVTIAPLLALQNQHVETFTSLGIRTIALNVETPCEDRKKLKNDIIKGFYQHIVISPEQCARTGSKLPMFTSLIEQDPAFCSRIRCLNFDEAHFVVTSGDPGREGRVFRPEYAKGSKVIIRLAIGTPCALYSATMPPPILTQIMKSLRIPPSTLRTSYLVLTTNRPNLCFAVRRLSKALSNLSNLNFLVPRAYHPPMARFKKTLIFVTSTDQAIAVEKWLNKQLPGFAQRIHSSLSSEFKTQIINDFTNSTGKFSALVSTTLLSNGFDPQDVELIIIYGAPTNMLDFEQMAGRGGRDGQTNCLVLLLAETWLFNEKKESNLNKCLRTEEGVFNYVQTQLCRRKFLATINDDNSQDALVFSGPHCCDFAGHSECLDLKNWLPNSRLCESGGQDNMPPTHSVQTSRTVYRPRAARNALEDLVIAWRAKVHSEDLISSIFPIGDILSSRSITSLARLRADGPELISESSMSSFLGKNQEWKDMYAQDLHTVIKQYDSSLPTKPGRKYKRKLNSFEALPESQFCSVLDFGSQSQSHTLPQTQPDTLSSAPGPSKRIKREVLGEIQLDFNLPQSSQL